MGSCASIGPCGRRFHPFGRPSQTDPSCAGRDGRGMLQVDVERTYRTAALDASIGRKARLPGLPRKGPESGRNPSFHLRAKWPSPPGPVFRFSGAEVVSEATASLVWNIVEKRVCEACS
jgi:hypothetical protein